MLWLVLVDQIFKFQVDQFVKNKNVLFLLFLLGVVGVYKLQFFIEVIIYQQLVDMEL